MDGDLGEAHSAPLDTKLMEFLMTLLSEHNDLKRRLERNDNHHKSELARIKHKIYEMEKLLRSIQVSQPQMREGSEFQKILPKVTLSMSHNEVQRNIEGGIVGENGNWTLRSNELRSSKKTKWNIQAVERLLKETRWADKIEEERDSLLYQDKTQADRHKEDHSNLLDPSRVSSSPQPKPRTSSSSAVKQLTAIISEIDDTRKNSEDESGAKSLDVCNLGTTGPLKPINLKFQWTFWVYKKNKKFLYEGNLMKGTTFNTWDHFISILNSVKSANLLPKDSKYIFFRAGLKPTYDDPGNVDGGKWILTFQKKSHAELNNRWRELVLCIIGGTFGDNSRYINGAEVSIRGKVDKISVWICRGLSQERAWNIRKMIHDRLFLDSTVEMKYQLHPKISHQESLSDFCF